jgi:hypothetical protein
LTPHQSGTDFKNILAKKFGKKWRGFLLKRLLVFAKKVDHNIAF